MDDNLVLLFFGATTCALVIVQVLRSRPPALLSHLSAPLGVLAAAAVGFLTVPHSAGYIATAGCLVFMLAPQVAASASARAAFAERFGRARRFAIAAAMLNPTATRRHWISVVDRMQGIARGSVQPEDVVPQDDSAQSRFLYAHALRATGRHAEFAEYYRSLPAEVRERDASLVGMQVRALGEIGALDEMVAAARTLESRPGALVTNASARLMTAAFLGQPKIVEQLVTGQVRGVAQPTAEFWLATALMVRGDPRGRTHMEALCAGPYPDVQRAARHRLTQPPRVLTERDLSPQVVAYVDELAADVASAAGLEGARGRRVGTLALMAVIALVFGLEQIGGSTDVVNLVQLGALLVPPMPGYDQPWRMLTAGLLHLGFTHFALNSFGLWVLGTRVEPTLGSLRFVTLFIGATLLGNLGALLWMPGPAVLVGASGGVMGLLGALLAILLRRRAQRRTRYVRNALFGMLAIVGLQVVFDSVMPNVGSTVHAAGFISGLLLGFLLLPRVPR